MPDNFEKVKTKILRDSTANGGPTNRDMVDLLEALHEDSSAAMELNKADHANIIASLDAHVDKLDDMEQRSLDVAAGFASVMDTPQFTSLMEERNRRVDDKISAHVAQFHLPDDEMGDIRRWWRTAKWFVILFVGAVIVMVGDQLGHIIFGGAT